MYVLMGANGNITSKAARRLLAEGKRVRVIGRDAARLKELADAGAETAIGDAQDARFLTDAFRGAEAVYAMIPPNYGEPDFRAYQNRLGEAIARAIREAGVRQVVNLSSIGAALPEGTGPIAGLHAQEERLNAISGLDVVHFRPGYFMENHLGAIPSIRGMGVYPGMIRADVPVETIATRDIAEGAARELTQPSGRGRRVVHLLGPRAVSMREAARILGAAIGRPDLAYVEAPPSDVKRALMGMGFSQSIANAFEEMSAALSDGRIARTIPPDSVRTSTTLEEFAETFAAIYRAA